MANFVDFTPLRNSYRVSDLVQKYRTPHTLTTQRGTHCENVTILPDHYMYTPLCKGLCEGGILKSEVRHRLSPPRDREPYAPYSMLTVATVSGTCVLRVPGRQVERRVANFEKFRRLRRRWQIFL